MKINRKKSIVNLLLKLRSTYHLKHYSTFLKPSYPLSRLSSFMDGPLCAYMSGLYRKIYLGTIDIKEPGLGSALSDRSADVLYVNLR